MESYNEHAKDLPELDDGDYVAVQNGAGSHPKRWDKTGRVMQKLPFRQYRVKVDGSNRLTLRNRKFLRKIDPVCAHRMPATASVGTQPSSNLAESTPNTPLLQQIAAPVSGPSTHTPTDDPAPTAPTAPTASEGVRRSDRVRRPREMFEANLQGKSHGCKTASQS